MNKQATEQKPFKLSNEMAEQGFSTPQDWLTAVQAMHIQLEVKQALRQMEYENAPISAVVALNNQVQGNAAALSALDGQVTTLISQVNDILKHVGLRAVQETPYENADKQIIGDGAFNSSPIFHRPQAIQCTCALCSIR